MLCHPNTIKVGNFITVVLRKVPGANRGILLKESGKAPWRKWDLRQALKNRTQSRNSGMVLRSR